MTDEITPFDATEVHSTKELCIRSQFDKLPFQPFNIKSEILMPPGQEFDPMIVATMLVGALNIWCHRIKETDQPLAREGAVKTLPLVNEMLKAIKVVHPETELKNLISQLGQNPNAGNVNNTPGVDQ